MSLSTSIQSYGDCLDFFERVIDDEKGGRVFMGTKEKAHYFQMRCNQARKLHRERNATIHEFGTPLHGTSEYDPLSFQIKMDTDGNYWVYAVKMKMDTSHIELLSDIDDTPLIEATEVRLIEDQSHDN